MKIEKALPTDAKTLTELTMRSKAHWGYPPEQILAWKEELTITPTYISQNKVFKLSKASEIIGFYTYKPITRRILKLNFLFVEPAYIGQGHGSVLLSDFMCRIEPSNYQKVILDADPNAEAFYKKHGFKVVGKLPSSIKDRFLPIMEKEIRRNTPKM